MKISENGLKLIKKFEGLRLRAYQCSAGIWTIGYGHTDNVCPTDVINELQADDYLKKDILIVENAIKKLVVASLDQNKFDALVCFVFNIGVNKFKSSTMLKKINVSDFNGAAEEFLRWVYVSRTYTQGLARRRKAEKSLFNKIENENNLNS